MTPHASQNAPLDLGLVLLVAVFVAVGTLAEWGWMALP